MKPAAALLALLLAPTALAQFSTTQGLPRVYTVHATDSSADFDRLTDAVAMTPAGATIVVRSDLVDEWHWYLGVRLIVVRHDVTIVSDRPGHVVEAGIGVANGADLTLVGFHITGKGDYGAVEDWEGGSVHAQDMIIGGDGWDQEAVDINDMFATLDHCTLVRPSMEYDYSTLKVDGDGVCALHDCQFDQRGKPKWSVSTWGNGTVYYDSDTHFDGCTRGNLIELPNRLHVQTMNPRTGEYVELEGWGDPSGDAVLFAGFPDLDRVDGLLVEPTIQLLGQFDWYGIADWSVRVPVSPSLWGRAIAFQQLDLYDDTLSIPQFVVVAE